MKLSEMTKSKPDSRNFEVIRSLIILSRWTVAEVRYPDVEHLDGHKILVFKGVVNGWLDSTDFIDPHFGEENMAPVARFNPVKDGWDNAVRFCYG